MELFLCTRREEENEQLAKAASCFFLTRNQFIHSNDGFIHSTIYYLYQIVYWRTFASSKKQEQNNNLETNKTK